MGLTNLFNFVTGPVLKIILAWVGVVVIMRALHQDHRGTMITGLCVIMGLAFVAMAVINGGPIAVGTWAYKTITT